MKKEHYRGRYLNISTPGVLIVDLARKQSGIVWAGVMHMHTDMQTYMQVCWWMFVCFPQGYYSPGAGEEWQMVGVSQSFRVA